MSVKIALAAISLGFVVSGCAEQRIAPAQPHPEGPSLEHNNNTYECDANCMDNHEHKGRHHHHHTAKHHHHAKKHTAKKHVAKKHDAKMMDKKDDKAEEKIEVKKDDAKK